MTIAAKKSESGPIQTSGQDESPAALALDAAQYGLWDWDRVSGRIYFSRQWKVLAGYGAEDLSDDPDEWFTRIHREDISLVKKNLKMHVEGTTAHFRSEHRLQHADGIYRWVLVRGAAIRDRKGTPVRIIGILTDISENKEHELQLLKQLDELRFAFASEKVLMEELDRKNRELVELSITDGLTGLYNHRFLQERLDFEFKRIRRYGGVLSCLLIDIDHFKSINDTHGHQFGDYVIREIASLIKRHSREVDICGRYGGEEFVIISNLEEHNALLFAMKLHDAVGNHTFEHPSAKVHVTVSIGVAGYDNRVKTKQELIERADRAMYQAKNEGRNLVRLWKPTQATDMLAVDKCGIIGLTEKLQELSGRMRDAYMEAVGALIKAVEVKDPFAHKHAQQVSHHAVAIAERMKLPAEQIEIIRCGALLHDIGKISVPDAILVKEQELTEDEHRVLNRHPEVGATILKDIRFLEKEVPLVLYHHERYDGKGFPHGLKSREIPLGARIVAVADAFDTMTCGRGGRSKLTVSKACAVLVKEKETRFSPDVVDAFLAVVRPSATGKKIRSES
jgi:diguanylate cyclase (GGDEF)-like protein/PAS domain S-box-containing protein/putative nucleotidyltransferase with HDIG domain